VRRKAALPPARKICRQNEKNVFTGDSTCGRIIPTAQYSTLTADVTFYIKCYIGCFSLAPQRFLLSGI
jgi:hypothetical protein